ncbi:ABC transporter ATP-binding protein [Shouchella lonarensis]|uniref:ATP-binding cassette, subfamily B n=1 Tax=Shouchella lonarensis TaxID=1464122 RepID=A0A1G6MRT4_9BACI|nr:ABC transporter ATP-binding protein [Shouchella lonarensis]SDC57696.1 ATP-binding cassette, subfamily B [Shouchella lonarensis]
MSTEKRLLSYALKCKGTIIFALVMLSIAVAAELTGPFIAKKIIDDHISGIEQPWYETDKGEHAVAYNGTYYTRAAYLDPADHTNSPVQIMQIGTRFFFTDQPLPTEGERSFENGTLRIENVDGLHESPAIQLSTTDVVAFYEPEIGPIMTLILWFLGIIVVASFFKYGQNYYLRKAANLIILRMRNDVFAHLSRVPVRFFDHQPAGKIVARITNDTEAIRQLYTTVLATFFSSTIYIFGIYIALFLLDVRLALITLALLPILFIWFKLYRKYASKFNRAIRAKNADINANMNESIHNMNIIQAFNQEQARMSVFEKDNLAHYHLQKKLLTLNTLTAFSLSDLLKNIVFVALIWYISGGTGGLLTLGVLYAFVDYINRLFAPVSQMVMQLTTLEEARASGTRVFELMDETGTDVDDETISRPKGLVTFDDVSFSYDEEEYVLKNLTFTVQPGETVALVGHTGSGKSSIMNLLFRFYDPQSGTINIDSVNTKTISPQALRAHMGIVLQEPYLFSGTIASNIAYGKPDATREEIETALRLVGGENVFPNMKDELDSVVTEKGSTLSSGQRQIISFARALLADPAILVLDEATSSIDTETERLIQTGITSLKHNRTTFVIAHRLSTIQDANQIIVLDKGQIIEHGTHESLLRAGGTYAHMYELQQGQAG